MRLQFMPFLWLFFSMASGIIAADLLNPDLYLCWSLFFAVFLGCVGLQLIRLQMDSVVRKIQFVFPLLLFFLFGQLLYQSRAPESDPHAVENVYLPGDRMLAEIVAISKTSGAFKKCEVEVRKLVRYKDSVPTRGRILVFLEDPENKLKRKDICFVQTDLEIIGNNRNPGEFDSQQFWKHKSIRRNAFVSEGGFVVVGRSDWEMMDWFVGLREMFSEILDKYLTGDENAVAKGLILGDRSSIDSEITRKFGNTGAMHVLAVSGLHVAILVQILTAFFGLFSRWISKNQALILALAIVWIYSALTGLSASVVRSAVMFSVLAGSTLLGKNYNGFNSLALSAVLILAWNPHFLYDIGFQLSYLAMVGIFLFSKPLSVLFYTRFKWIQLAWEGTMVGIAAQIMTVPLTLYYFHQFPNYFILTNLGLMVFSFLVLALGIALFVTVWINPVAKFVALLLTFSMFLMLWIIDFVDALPGAVSNGFVLEVWEVVLLFVLIIAFYAFFVRRKIKPLIAVLTVCIGWIGFMVHNRFERMQASQVCFFQAKEPTFIVKRGAQSFCFFGNRAGNRKKATYLAESYQKVLPGTLHYFEISNKKHTSIQFENDSIEIDRVKGGYAIQVFGADYFYATSDVFYPPKGKVIAAPWLSGKKFPYQLCHGSVTFNN